MKIAMHKIRHVARNRYTQAGAALTALAVAGTANASEGGTGAEAAFSALESQASDFADSAWPVVVAVVGSLIAISMFKKFANRAS
ncbi:MAG: major coat protein [Pseudomonadota bacterium]